MWMTWEAGTVRIAIRRRGAVYVCVRRTFRGASGRLGQLLGGGTRLLILVNGNMEGCERRGLIVFRGVERARESFYEGNGWYLSFVSFVLFTLCGKGRR